MRSIVRLTGLSILAVLIVGSVSFVVPTSRLHAQGYSGGLPNVATPASGLVVTYSNGTVTSGGLQTAITGATVTVSDAQTDCSAPGFASCNFVYWHTGSSLSTTTNVQTATVPGNVIVAYVTSTGGNVSLVTPSQWNVAQPGATSATITDRFIYASPTNCAFAYTTTAVDTNFPQWEVPATGQTVYSTQTNSTSGTVTATCLITLPASRTTAGTGMTVTGVDAYYGVVTTSLTSVTAPVINTITYPATVGGSAAGTVSTTGGGSLTITPGSLQVAAVTSGLLYRMNMAFGTPLAVNSSNVQLSITMAFVTNGGGSTKTKIQLGGFTVFYKGA